MQSRFGVGQPGADLVAAQDQRHPVVDAVHRGIGRGGQNHKPIGPMDDCNKCVLKYQCPRGCIGDCLANGSIHETDGGCFFRKENAIRQLLKQSEAIVAEHMQF